MRARPVSPAALVATLAERVLAFPGDHVIRVAVDGAPAASPDVVADALSAAITEAGRLAIRLSARDFQRPASLRLEHGREDADAYYDDTLDVGGLLREVLVPLGPGGDRRYLPTLWDAVRDRATRAGYRVAPPGAVAIVDGVFLLTPTLRWEFELAVHLAMTGAGLARRTPPEWAWTLPAFARYDDEVSPTAVADVVVRCDDPAHPALVVG